MGRRPPRTTNNPMSNEQEQYAQRQAKLEELKQLGVSVFPTAFARTSSVTDIVKRHGGASAEELESDKPRALVAGRILGIRSFGKANFLVLSDGLERLQVYVRED